MNYKGGMPRVARLVIAGGTYHVLSRGNNRQVVFPNDADKVVYQKLLSRYMRRYCLHLYHYSLMINHVHLILFSPKEPALSRAMHGLNLTYAQYFRRKYGGIGHFWQDRFKSFLIQKDSYLLECGRYAELNGVRAGVYKSPEDDEWSSYRFYAFGRPDSLLTENPLFECLGSNEKKRRERYRKFISDGLKERRGLARYFRQKICGAADYQKTILETLGVKPPKVRRGRPKKA